MGGMYPDNREIEIFGEPVNWPGMGADGKFTNGSFSDPMVKASFIPAESINLLIDNISDLIVSMGGKPNNTDTNQLGKAFLNRLENDARAWKQGDESVLAEIKNLIGELANNFTLSLAEAKKQIREEEWPVGSLYIQHMNDASPIERGLPGEWAIWSHRADGYGLVHGALPDFTVFREGDTWAKDSCKLWHIEGGDWRLFVANETLTNLPDPRYIDPVKCAPFQSAIIVERRNLQGWTDADFVVGDVINGGAYDGWTVCEVIVPGGKFPSVEGGLRPTFVSGGVAGDAIRNILGGFGSVSREWTILATEAFFLGTTLPALYGTGHTPTTEVRMDVSLVVPTGPQNSPETMAVRWLRRVA